jgi:DNA-binding NtrC family response regulator
MDLFLNKTWEGNVRELENVIRQGILFSSTNEINPRDVHLDGRQNQTYPVEGAGNDLPYKAAKEQTLKLFNHSFIGRLLEAHGGNVSQAARQCGLERQALQQIMRRYQIRADDFRN